MSSPLFKLHQLRPLRFTSNFKSLNTTDSEQQTPESDQDGAFLRVDFCTTTQHPSTGQVSHPVPSLQFCDSADVIRYQCRICEKWKPKELYSNKELNTYTYKVGQGQRLNGVTADLRCRTCSGQQVAEYECNGTCGQTKPIAAFSKSARGIGGSNVSLLETDDSNRTIRSHTDPHSGVRNASSGRSHWNQTLSQWLRPALTSLLTRETRTIALALAFQSTTTLRLVTIPTTAITTTE